MIGSNLPCRGWPVSFHIAAVVAWMMIPSAAIAQQAVQWRVQDGGNGHWYARMPRTSESWDTLRVVAEQRGGRLASATSAAENQFLRSVAFPPGVSGHSAMGGLRAGGACGGAWQWIDGSPFSYANWDFSQPECSGEEVIVMYSSGRWHDYPRGDFVGSWTGVLIEWSADCNGDGIVDYGQILQGHLPDTNSSGIPDGCECTDSPALPACCIGNLNGDSAVDGADLGILLNAWGTCAAPCAADLNRDGFVDGSDLGLLLGNWGSCP